MTPLPLLPVALLVGVFSPALDAPTSNLDASGEIRFPSALESARVEVVAGRAIVVGGGLDGLTMRRGEAKSARGRTHLEVPLGGQVRIWWTETMSMDVFGPSSLEWFAEGAQVTSLFHQLSWADVEVRRGQHEVSLPASWRATLGRGAFRLRGIAGGPSELFQHAGQPALLEWLGNPTQPIPPVFVHPGSSVRLDQPRHVPRQPALPDGEMRGAAWDLGSEAESLTSVWPWRSRTDTDADVIRRQRIGRTTRLLDETLGVPGGRFERVVTPVGPGVSAAGPVASPGAVRTFAQIPVTPAETPDVAIEERKTRRVGGAAVEATTVREAGEPSRQEALEQLAPGGGASFAPDKVGAMPFATEQVGAREALRAGSEPPRAVPFDAAQWRGLERAQLNGTGVLAAERGGGVEFRVLGGGRTKVFVSSGSPAPRWCFTPRADYLMQPGAVAVFEADGRLRMSFGTLEEHPPQLGRPTFDRLPTR